MDLYRDGTGLMVWETHKCCSDTCHASEATWHDEGWRRQDRRRALLMATLAVR